MRERDGEGGESVLVVGCLWGRERKGRRPDQRISCGSSRPFSCPHLVETKIGGGRIRGYEIGR